MNNRDDLEPLAPELAALLDEERGRPDLPLAAQERLLERVEQSALAGDQAPRPRSDGWRRAGKWLATFIAGLLIGGGLVAWWLRRAPTKVLALIESTDAPAPRAGRVVIVPPVRPVVPRALTPPALPPEAQVPLDRDLALGRERALLETARTAASRGQPEATLAVLAEHARQFPLGRLSEERESLWVQVLVQARRFPEARERAVRFRREFPSSLLLPAVEAALRSIP